MRVEHVGLRVTQLERSKRFYEAFGLKVVGEDVGSQSDRACVVFEDPRTTQRLELNWYPPNSPKATPYSVGEALDHLGFGVEDAAESFRRLVAGGAKPALEPWAESDGVVLAYVEDPDGIWIELFSGGQTTQLGLEYVGIRVTELGRALRLYKAAVGLLEVGRGTMSHGGVWVDLLDPRTTQRLELNWYPRGSRFNWAYMPGEALDHIALVADDFSRDLDSLRAAGCTIVEEPKERGGGLVALLENSDGVRLELRTEA